MDKLLNSMRNMAQNIHQQIQNTQNPQHNAFLKMAQNAQNTQNAQNAQNEQRSMITDNGLMLINQNPKATGCSDKVFANNADYNYKPLELENDLTCPPGYSKLGNSCLSSLTKRDVNRKEVYSDFDNDILNFDNNKKLIQNKDLHTFKEEDRFKYLVKKCPIKHPEDSTFTLNPIETEKTRTTTEVKCIYNKIAGRDIYKKDTCVFTECNSGDTKLACGNSDANDECSYKVEKAKENCDRTYNDCWNRIREAERNCRGEHFTNYVPNQINQSSQIEHMYDESSEEFKNQNVEHFFDDIGKAIRGAVCDVFVNKIGGEAGCSMVKTGCGAVDKLGNLGCSVGSGLGPLLCGRPCQPGYIPMDQYILSLPLQEQRDKYGITDQSDTFNRRRQLRQYKFRCISNKDVKLCYPERLVDIDSSDKTWINYCNRKNNLTKDNACLNALTRKYINQKDINEIYKKKCANKINRSDLVEVPRRFSTDKIEKVKLTYPFLAQKCFNINTDQTLKNPTPNSSYQLDIALPFLANEIKEPTKDQNGEILNVDNLQNIFDRYELLIDSDIINALKNGEFRHKLTEELCNDGVKAYKITFYRVKYGSNDDECCFNLDNLSLDGKGINYYQAVNSNNPNPSETDKMHFVENVFGAKTTCNPKLKKIEGGNNICKSALNDFCTEENNEGVPKIIEFTDDKQIELKHKRCDIDFKKMYKNQYEGILKQVCNDYDLSKKNDFIRSNKICKEYCGPKQEKCMKGMRRYCTKPDKTKVTPLFTPDCEKFMGSDVYKDTVMKNFCVSLSTGDLYKHPKCKEFREGYEKCLVNNIGDSICDDFYSKNKNITAEILNKKCDKNPNLPYCNKKIFQKDMYKNEYIASPNERESILNIMNEDSKKYFKTSEENILKTKNKIINKEITNEKMKYCLEENEQTSNCKQIIDNYMSTEFIDRCIKGNKDSFDKEQICIDIKKSKITNFENKIKNFCADKESSVYNLADCKKIENIENEKKNKKKLIIGIIIILIIIIIITIIKIFI